MTEAVSAQPLVYQAIANVTDAISKVGVAKTHKNQQQGYTFRGIDDIYNALAPELAKNRLCILPNVLERSFEERVTAKGNAIFYVTVRVRFDFVSAEDGSKHEVVTLGEAMDTADKATNKAMSAAYKYATMMAFCIPTIGDDSENETHETRSMQPKPPRPLPSAPTNGAEIREPGTVPFRPTPGAVPFRPPTPPAHNPETGEIGPYVVPLPLTDRGPDFVKWGGGLIAGIRSSANLAEAQAWEKMNTATMKKAEGTRALSSVIAAFDRVYAQFINDGGDDDVVSEADAKNVLDAAQAHLAC